MSAESDKESASTNSLSAHTNETKVAVHIEALTACGHTYKQVIYLASDRLFEYTVSTEPFISTVQPKPRLNLVGHIEQIEIDSRPVSDEVAGFGFCRKCGAPLMYLGRPDFEGITLISPKETTE